MAGLCSSARELTEFCVNGGIHAGSKRRTLQKVPNALGVTSGVGYWPESTYLFLVAESRGTLST